MTNLSPAAQAVLDAAVGVLESADAEAIAAAILRAVAYQIAPAKPSLSYCCERQEQKMRHQLLAIAAELDGPLWLKLRGYPGLSSLELMPNQLAILLEYIAAVVEYRGSIDADRDPGETSDWLKREANRAMEAAE